ALIGDLEGILADIGDGNQKAHQHEKRDNAKNVTGDRVGRTLGQHADRHFGAILDQPDSDERCKSQRDRYMQAEPDQKQHPRKGDEADFQSGHERSAIAVRKSRPAMRRYWMPIAALPIRISNLIGQVGAVKSPAAPTYSPISMASWKGAMLPQKMMKAKTAPSRQ